jgi:hypothetical protein
MRLLLVMGRFIKWLIAKTPDTAQRKDRQNKARSSNKKNEWG